MSANQYDHRTLQAIFMENVLLFSEVRS